MIIVLIWWTQKFFVVFTFPVILVAIVGSDKVSSISTDLSTYVLSLVSGY